MSSLGREEGRLVNEVWVLGGTGRTGRAIAAELARRGAAIVLVGRDASRLDTAARALGARMVVAGSPTAMAEAIRRERPAVTVNTIGPFQQTAAVIADAALEGGDYVDLGNDVATISQLVERDEPARRAGHTLVTGAGFGVTATESVVTWLVEGRPPAARVRIDMIPSIASTAGVVGDALAATLTEGLPGIEGGGRFQGRRITHGRLAKAPFGGSPTRLTTPDGDQVTTALLPLGELLAAEHASKAPFVDAGSSEAPSGALARLVMPAGLTLLHIAPLRRFATRRLAAVKVSERPRPRKHSWAHARVQWADGTTREGWLRLPDANDFTATVAAEVTNRLLAGQGRPGTYTPAALFGSSLAESCGGEYLLAEELNPRTPHDV
ncbi:saccharopine dehydrogenase NADP-binding domain-containing protein [Nonomuraea sp. NPDC046802]|uniref:saccharopine dehydrogenase NADP-binding domain-containing protein n=1 Tax=Nonomuraea sp. NPDC046802 TaxID=3154919 RepID=UPI0033EC8605